MLFAPVRPADPDYGAFRRKVGADKPGAKASAEAVTIIDTRVRNIDGRFDAPSQTLEQRFDLLSQRFDAVNQAFDGLSRAIDKRFNADAMDQRLDVLNEAMDQRFGAFGKGMGQRVDALSRAIDDRLATINERFAAVDVLLVRLETKTATLALMDARLARLETKTATKFRHLLWGVSIAVALMLGLVAKAILDWAMPMLSLSYSVALIVFVATTKSNV